MSFDLYFYREDLSLPPGDKIKEYFESLPLFETRELSDGFQFNYQNDATGVYFNFEYHPIGGDIHCALDPRRSLSLRLNYNRSAFFAYEAMPLVQRFCERFKLFVEDVQEDHFTMANATTLIKSWRLHNERAVTALSQQGVDLKYLSEQKAEAWWRYTRIKKHLEDSLQEDLFVPDVIVLEGPEKRLFRMIVWPGGISQFFPNCDYVFITREKASPSHHFEEESGLIPYEVILSGMMPSLDFYQSSEGPIPVLRSEWGFGLASKIRTFELIPIDLSTHIRILPDGFHDVDLNGESEVIADPEMVS